MVSSHLTLWIISSESTVVSLLRHLQSILPFSVLWDHPIDQDGNSWWVRKVSSRWVRKVYHASLWFASGTAHPQASRWLSRQRICLQWEGAGRCGFDPWVRKMTWRRKWEPTPVFLPGESHGQRSLVGLSPWVTNCETQLKQLRIHSCSAHPLPREFLTNGNLDFFPWISCFPLIHKESLPTPVSAAKTIFLNWTQVCFPLVSVLALYRIDHSDSSFRSLILFSVFLFSLCWEAAYVPVSWDSESDLSQTKINTALLRLFPSSNLPLTFLYCIFQTVGCTGCVF